MKQDKEGHARFEIIRSSQCDMNSWNPNSMDQDDYNRLVREIEDVGFIVPIHVVPIEGDRYRIIGGEHRVAAALDLKLETIPAMILEGPRWEDEDLQKLVTVRLNMLRGKINPEKMAVLYRDMAKKYGEDALRDLFAFTDQHGWDKLISGIKQGLSKAGLPKEKQKQFSERAKEAKTLKDLERILNELWSSYGDTVNLSFMIFTYGNREHIYVSMTKDTRAALKRISKYCKGHAKDINEVLGPAMVALADVLEKKEAEEGVKDENKTGPEQDNVVF